MPAERPDLGNVDITRPQLETIHVMIQCLDDKIKSLDEKTKLMVDEAEKRNGQRFDAQQEAVAAAMVSAEKAVTKAEIAAEKRFESVNEFRQTLSDQSATFLTRTEYSVQHGAIGEKIDAAIIRVAANETMINDIRARGAGRSDIWGIMVGAIGIIISMATLALLFMRK